MKKFIWILLIIFVFSSCSSQQKIKELEIIKKIENSSPKAFLQANKLYIEIDKDKHFGSPYVLSADVFSEKKVFNSTYNFNFSYLKNLNDEEKNEINWEIAEEVKVFPGEIWEKINKDALDKIIPEEKNKALIYSNYYYEYLVYRQEDNSIKIIDWEKTDPDKVEVVGKIDEEELKKINLKLLKNFITKENLENDKFLFVINKTNKYHQVFVYVNAYKKDVNYLFIPIKINNPQVSFTNYLIYNAIGLLNNPFTVTSRFIYWVYNSGYILIGPGIKDSKEILPINKNILGMDLDLFDKYLDKISSLPVYRGKIDILIDGEEFFQDFIYRLFNAKKSINIRTYIFDNDDYAVKIADILKVKAENIDVKVLMDSLGSITASNTMPNTSMPVNFIMPKRIDKYLRKNSKVKARTAKNPWFTTDHVKTFILDNETAYIGGMNIGREYRYEWHDMMLRVEGPVVGRINKDFYTAWAHSGFGGDIAYLFSKMFRISDNKMPDKKEYTDMRILYTKTNKAEIHNAVLEGIKRSKKYIYIQNAYFTDDRIINELIKARARGVDVRIILPYWGNHNIINASNIITSNHFVKNGIRVFLYPGMTHVKATIIDDWAMVGTANYDKLSMRVNQEINLAFSDKETVDELLKRLFEKDFMTSMEVKGEFPVPWYNYILEKIANQL